MPMETIITIPTDEGRSWYVVFVAFCQNFVKESMPFTFLIIIALNSWNYNLELGFLIGSIYFAMMYLFSPLACALANWYSFKVLNIAGPFLMTVSMIISTLTTSNELHPYLILSFSLLGGFGSSMIHMSSKLMPSYWFCNRRQLAHSISCSGQAFGFLVMPHLTYAIYDNLSEFHMMNLFCLYSVLLLPLILMGVLTPHMAGIKVHFMRKVEDEKPKVRFFDEVSAAEMSESLETLNNRSSFRLFRTHHNLVFPRVKDLIGKNDITIIVPEESMTKVLLRPFRHGTRTKARIVRQGTSVVFGGQKVNVIYRPDVWLSPGARPMYRIDIFFTWTLFRVSLYHRQDNQLDFHLAATRALTTRDLNQEVIRKRRVLCPEAMLRTLITMLDCSIFPNAYYIMLQINLVLISAGQIVPLIFLPSRGIEAGHEIDAFFLLTYAGLGQILGRLIITGIGLFTTDHGFYNCTIFILLLGGFFTITAGFVQSYYHLMVYSIVFGVIYGMIQSFRLTVIYTIIRLSNLTNTMGHSLIGQAMASLLAINGAGYLFSHYKSVSYVYIFSGGILMFSGFFLIAVHYTKNCTFRNLTLPA